MSPRRRALGTVVVVLALVALTSPGPAFGGTAQEVGGPAATATEPTAAAGSATPSPGDAVAAVRPEAPDYAAEVLANPWDYSDQGDRHLLADIGTYDGWRFPAIGGGTASWTTAAGRTTQLLFLRNWGPEAMYVGNHGAARPIDADRFTRIAMRVYSSQNVSAGIFWHACPAPLPECLGGNPIALNAGWNTVLFDPTLPSQFGADADRPWAGDVVELSLVVNAPAGVATTTQLDWVRVYRPSGHPDTDPYPPGAAPQALDARPRPVVIDPDVGGGDDWATVELGNPWDFSDAADVAAASNATITVSGGKANGSSAGPQPNDPVLWLNVPKPIDACTYHRVTLRMEVDGPFGLKDAPGGGAMARVPWVLNHQGGSLFQESQDLVFYPGEATYQFALKSQPPELVVEDSIPTRLGWCNPGVPSTHWPTALRIDPHEDPGSRSWRIDEVRLARNDRVVNGGFDIRFEDKAWEAGTTATIAVSASPEGTSPTTIATGVPVAAGVNTYRWNGFDVPAGSWYVVVTLTDPGGSSTASVSTGPVDSPGRPVNPFGAFDVATSTWDGTSNGVEVSGWATDPDSKTTPIPTHVYLTAGGSTTGVPLTANGSRPDVASAVPGHGPLVGWSHRFPSVPPGRATVCAYAINVGPGGNVLLGCRDVMVPSRTSGVAPVGASGVRANGAASTVTVDGWTFDPDRPMAPIDVHVYVDGVGARNIRADVVRPDVGAVFPHAGPTHGFVTEIPVARGSREVCVYAIGSAGTGGGNALLGCHRVNVGSPPIAFIDSIRPAPGGVRVTGWALDPDTVAGTTDVHLYPSAGPAVAASTNVVRNDVKAAFSYLGPVASTSGFDVTLTGIPPGRRSVCVFAIDEPGGPGWHNLVGCPTVDVPTSDPIGFLDVARGVPGGVRVEGWVLDPDVAGAIGVHVYVGGAGHNLGMASGSRPDVANAFPGWSANRGFASTVPAAPGTYPVCVFAINATGTPGSNRLISCSTVVVPG